MRISKTRINIITVQEILAGRVEIDPEDVNPVISFPTLRQAQMSAKEVLINFFRTGGIFVELF